MTETKSYPLNAWYAAAWSHEIKHELAARRICDKDVVLYRRSDGGVVALEDACWHRLLPLSLGRLKGDEVVCGYHGLVFNSAGRCSYMPAQKTINPSAAVRAYPTCGPIGMLEAAKRHWQHSGRPIDQLRFETFGNSGRFASEPFKVKIPRLGAEIDVPLNQTMLDALEAVGIEMISDCRRGECGLCALPILATDGIVDHRDVFFSDEEKAANSKLCTCVSRVVGGSITVDTADRVA